MDSNPSSSHFHLQETSTFPLVAGPPPSKESILFELGSYQILRSLGKGGMGEVFLAYDASCGRLLALKKIRKDLIEHPQLQHRFLKEARITCQLTHPAIIPIHTIHVEQDLIYYTMPYVEGETLKEILRTTRRQEKKGEKLHHIGGSIPALIRIFLTVCQAVGYAHSKGVLHRDIKPENIMIGKYGEVMILDWGLAKLVGTEETQAYPDTGSTTPGITQIGKVVGTVAYMAPERAIGHPSNVQSDIYSLGVMLFQMLTLRPPFMRGSLKEFRQNMAKEVLRDPIELSPYRDIPKTLAQMATKALSIHPEERYSSIDELIDELENYIEGRGEWFSMRELDVQRKGDWEFQENVLISEHTAIVRHLEVFNWVSLMISKESFSQDILLTARVKLGPLSQGIGFLLSVPEAEERTSLLDGYCIFFGSDLSPSTSLLRSGVEVMQDDEIFLRRGEWATLKIEKVDRHMQVYLNGRLEFSSVSHLPLIGTHIGILSRDADFTINHLKVWVGSHTIRLSCLAVPDAFLAHKDYQTALTEYRRIGYAFPGRAEGREAMFRAGITLLEQAIHTDDSDDQHRLLDLSILEFEKLRQTTGAPLEYLGKALVYQELKNTSEEIKCYEMSLRRYPKHPLHSILQEEILSRTQQCSRSDREATYNLILLVLRHLPDALLSNHMVKLLQSLKKHWEPLYFIEEIPQDTPIPSLTYAIPIAFWLGKGYVLAEMVKEIGSLDPIPVIPLSNLLFSLLELQEYNLLRQIIDEGLQRHRTSQNQELHTLFEEFHAVLDQTFPLKEEKLLLHALSRDLDEGKIEEVLSIARQKPAFPFQCLTIWAALALRDWDLAHTLFEAYPLEKLTQEATLLHFLYGCWLGAIEGKEIADIHFQGLLEVPFPRSWTLGSYYLSGRLSKEWMEQAFPWEKKQLERQLQLWEQCTGEKIEWRP